MFSTRKASPFWFLFVAAAVAVVLAGRQKRAHAVIATAANIGTKANTAGLRGAAANDKNYQEQSQQRRLWKEDGHDELMDLGIHQLYLSAFASQPEVVNFKLFWDSIDFQRGAYLGIEEADASNVGEFAGAIFSSHFYDPDTERNYIGFGDFGFSASGLLGFFGMNAKTESVKRMGEAIKCGQTIYAKLSAGSTITIDEYYKCGFELGLGLHYLTDLTQPMHAANFGNGFGNNFFLNLSPSDNRHADYEEIADNLMNAGYLDDTPDIASFAEISSVGLSGVDSVLEDTARRSKDIWTDLLLPQLPEVGGIDWGYELVKQSLDVTVRDYGYRNVAMYLCYFGRLVAS